jgi:succinoglycan biosynthesis protein ExoM
MLSGSEHITVCICTFKRAATLAHLLNELENQRTENLFTYSIVVIDNDADESGRETVDSFKRKSTIPVKYYVEPEQNIALARNRAVQNSNGNFLAFIDDDEFPMDDWLLKLYEAIKHFKADGVLGPVIPHFEVEPPKWVVKGKLCERESFRTGTHMKNHRDMRTGNVLLSKVLFDKNEMPFDARFGETGGEDSDFFRKRVAKGGVFIWCNEAHVYETVPAQRLKRIYFVKRALLRGVTNSQAISLLSISAVKSAIASICYTLALPAFLLAGQHIFMNYLIRDCDHLGKILAVFGLKLVTKRTF